MDRDLRDAHFYTAETGAREIAGRGGRRKRGNLGRVAASWRRRCSSNVNFPRVLEAGSARLPTTRLLVVDDDDDDDDVVDGAPFPPRGGR